MNKKFGDKYYNFFSNEYIEIKSILKKEIIYYNEIEKIYICSPMYDDKNQDVSYVYDFKIKMFNCNKFKYFSINTYRKEFVEIIDFLVNLNIFIQTSYYDERKGGE